MCCASCGIAGVDGIKLKLCDRGCDLVKYCSDGCQELHRPDHIGVCNKRKKELHDKKLFTQPDISHLGECPICYLPLSIDECKSTMMGCCSKTICNGCMYANREREREGGLEHRCAFCREPLPTTEDESDKQTMKRIEEHNDPDAMRFMGKQHAEKGDYMKAFEYYTKAAELGDVEAFHCLGLMYNEGRGVQKDMKKAIHHFEQAAIGGHPRSRGVLGIHEKNNGRFERAAKHFIINANLGADKTLRYIKEFFVAGIVSKEEYAAALRACQDAVDATKSVEREKAEIFLKQLARMGLGPKMR